jgi:hypothetical protein
VGFLRSWLAAGIGGTIAITASSTLEMKLRGRPPSTAPIDTIERLLGRRLPSRWRAAAGNAGHLASGLALGLPRALLWRAGVREPAATVAFLPVACLPDMALVPALGVSEPPWRWGPAELAISALHHAAYATGASVAIAGTVGPWARLPFPR